jgi:BlaI family transcriptional regulator, penicillinase repressor
MANSNEIAATVSDAEVEVLQQLWLEAPLSAQDIIDRLEKQRGAHPKTVKTLINRLLNKGALSYQEENRKYLYFPLIKKEDFYRTKTESFLGKFFEGDLLPLVSLFSSQKKFSKKQINELKQLIEKLEASHGKD